MKTLKNITGLCLSMSLLVSACTKKLEKMNEDPNRPKGSTPGVMLGQLQYRIVNTTINEGRFFTHELMQVDAPRSSNSEWRFAPVCDKPRRCGMEQFLPVYDRY